MKTKLILLAVVALLSSCGATGFNRKVPASVSNKGKFEVLRYRVFEVPDTWDKTFNPLNTPGFDSLMSPSDLGRIPMHGPNWWR